MNISILRLYRILSIETENNSIRKSSFLNWTVHVNQQLLRPYSLWSNFPEKQGRHLLTNFSTVSRPWSSNAKNVLITRAHIWFCCCCLLFLVVVVVVWPKIKSTAADLPLLYPKPRPRHRRQRRRNHTLCQKNIQLRQKVIIDIGYWQPLYKQISVLDRYLHEACLTGSFYIFCVVCLFVLLCIIFWQVPSCVQFTSWDNIS